MPVKRQHSTDDLKVKTETAQKKIKKAEPNGEEKPLLDVIQFSEEDYYRQMEFNPTHWLANWEGAVVYIRDKKNYIAENNLTMEEVQDAQRDMLLKVSYLRQLNRHIQYHLRQGRDETKSISIKCDQDDVQLQNVLYEQKHLSREADACLQFKSRHHKFNELATKKDVKTHGGLTSDAFAELAADPHKMTMARLEVELKQRQNRQTQLETEKSALDERRQTILEQDQQLGKVDQQLSKILALTAPICDTFGIDTDRIININTKAAKLSTQLSHLFKQLSQQLENADFKCIENPKLDIFEETVPSEGFTLSLNIKGKTSTAFTMKFKQETPDSPILVSCSQPHIAACLFQEAERYGYCESSTTTTDTDPSAYVQYNWVQEMCGSAKIVNPAGGLAPPQIFLTEIDRALSLNKASSQQLSEYLMKKKFPSCSPEMTKRFKGVKPFARIERFEEMSYDKYRSLSLSSKVIAEGLARPSQKYFVGRLKRYDAHDNAPQALNFAVAIPHSTNVGCIFSVEQNSKFTSSNKLALRLIETEINNHVPFSDNILADQMFILSVLYDVLVEVESVQDQEMESDAIGALTRTKNFSNDMANNAFTSCVPSYDPFTGIFSE